MSKHAKELMISKLGQNITKIATKLQMKRVGVIQDEKLNSPFVLKST